MKYAITQNGSRAISYWICAAGELFDNVIIHNRIPISDMPPVLQSQINERIEDNIKNDWLDRKNMLVKVCEMELGSRRVECSIPSPDDILSATKENPLNWDPSTALVRGQMQSEESCKDQMRGIKMCVNGIKSYLDIIRPYFPRSIVFEGAPGTGKSFCIMVLCAYCLSIGLKVMTTAVQATRALCIGGMHMHKLFAYPAKKSGNFFRLAEEAIQSLLKYPITMNMLETVNVLFFDEIGQVSAEMISVLDMILREVRNCNIFLRGILGTCAMDHRQLDPMDGKPFLTSLHVITCFSTHMLKHSVRASADPQFQRLQILARMSPDDYADELISEFKSLLSSVCTFVDDWSSPEITPNTVRFYAKRCPVNEASRMHIDGVKSNFTMHQCRERKAIDLQKQAHSHQEWIHAEEAVSILIDNKVKEPATLIFFIGGVYEFACNENGQFNQSFLMLSSILSLI